MQTSAKRTFPEPHVDTHGGDAMGWRGAMSAISDWRSLNRVKITGHKQIWPNFSDDTSKHPVRSGMWRWWSWLGVDLNSAQ